MTDAEKAPYVNLSKEAKKFFATPSTASNAAQSLTASRVRGLGRCGGGAAAKARATTSASHAGKKAGSSSSGKRQRKAPPSSAAQTLAPCAANDLLRKELERAQSMSTTKESLLSSAVKVGKLRLASNRSTTVATLARPIFTSGGAIMGAATGMSAFTGMGGFGATSSVAAVASSDEREAIAESADGQDDESEDGQDDESDGQDDESDDEAIETLADQREAVAAETDGSDDEENNADDVVTAEMLQANPTEWKAMWRTIAPQLNPAQQKRAKVLRRRARAGLYARRSRQKQKQKRAAATNARLSTNTADGTNYTKNGASSSKGASKGTSKCTSKTASRTAGKTACKTASTPDAQPVYTDVIEGLEDRRLEDKQIQYLARVMSTTTTASASASASRTEWFTCSQLKRQKAAGTESIEKMMRVLDDQLWCSSSGGGISMAASAVASIGSANKTVRVKVEPVSQRFATAGPLARPICTASANKPARAVKVEPHHRVARRSIRAQQLMIGTRVMAFPACSPNTAKRYPGRIAAYCGNNCYNVDYDDGDQDTEVPRVNINVCDP